MDGGGQGLRGSQVSLGSGAPQGRSQEIWKTGQGFRGCRVRRGSLRSGVGAHHPAAHGLPPPVGRTAESLGTVDCAPRPARARVKTLRPAASVQSPHDCPELSASPCLPVSCFHRCLVLPRQSTACLCVQLKLCPSCRCCPTPVTLVIDEPGLVGLSLGKVFQRPLRQAELGSVFFTPFTTLVTHACFFSACRLWLETRCHQRWPHTNRTGRAEVAGSGRRRSILPRGSRAARMKSPHASCQSEKLCCSWPTQARATTACR